MLTQLSADRTAELKSYGVHEGDMAWGENDMFLKCDKCQEVFIANEMYCTMKHICCDRHRLSGLDKALQAARAARFEHGEIPQ